MIPTSLYIKQHNKTGKLYFGKTTSVDPVVYSGSGLYWSRHMNEHGNNITTLWHTLFTEESDIFEFATFFSEFFDIVNSDKWANLIPETGLDGFPPGGKMPPRSAMHKKNWADSKKGWAPSAKTKKIWSEQRTGVTVSDRTKKLHSLQTSRGKNPNALEWQIQYPTGEVVKIKGLRAFCRENNLPFNKIYYSIGGWRSIKYGTGNGGGRKRKINVE